MHISCIERYVIGAKLGGVIGLELIEVAPSDGPQTF
jgi:hypothetical protein